MNGSHIVSSILLIPALTAALLAILPGYRLSARLNVLASGLTLVAASLLFNTRPAPNSYLLVDDFNIYLIVLNTFVAFTTSVFSASYIAHELESGRLTPVYLRFYHAMYQVLRGQMNTRPSKEIRDALILNILVRIDLLNQQIERLEDLKKEKKKGASA